MLVGSTRVPQEAGFPQRFRLRMPKLPMYFTGTGDLVAALLLARTAESPGRLTHAVELAIASVQGAPHAVVIEWRERTAVGRTAAAAVTLARVSSQGAAVVIWLCRFSIAGTLANTAAAIGAAGGESATAAARELRLVQSQEEIKNPVVVFRCEPLVS